MKNRAEGPPAHDASDPGLAHAQVQLEAFRQAVDQFFENRPFVMRAAPIDKRVEVDLYRFRLVRSIPRSVEKRARRVLYALKPLAERLELPPQSLLLRLSKLPVHWWRSVLIPGVKAGSVLEMDGEFDSPVESLDPPVWNFRRREVTITRTGAQSQFPGRMDVQFHLELKDDPLLTGQSAVALIGASLREAATELAQPEGGGEAAPGDAQHQREQADLSDQQNA